MRRPLLFAVVLLVVVPSGALAVPTGAAHAPSAGGARATAAAAVPAVSGGGPGWTKLVPVGGPSARANASMDYDGSLGGDLLFGGWNGTFLSDTWEFRAGNWTRLNLTVHPTARSGASLVYDDALGASILFGGTNGKALGDTWEFHRGGWQVLTVTPAPPARSGAAAAYDPQLSKIVLFGGIATQYLADTWTYSGTGWQQDTRATHPTKAAYASMALDTSDGLPVLYGGASTTPVATTWEYTVSGWLKLTEPHPPAARAGAGFAYDAADGVAVLFGGVGSTSFGNTWQFDGGSWTALNPTVHPTNRSLPAMAYDDVDGYVLLFGGLGPSGALLGDSWSYHIRAGTPGFQTLAVNVAPHQREQGVTAYDPIDGYTVLFGGWNSTATNLSRMFYGDTWTYKAGTWTQLHPATSPAPRRGAMMVFDPIDGYLLLFGGSNGTQYFNDTWSFRNGNWTQLHPVAAPSPRRSSAIAFDAVDGYVLLFGGHNGTGVLVNATGRYTLHGDTWTYRAGTWTQLNLMTHPSARAEPNMDFDGTDGYVLLYGGYTQHINGFGEIEQSDTWEFQFGQWTNLSSRLEINPGPRDGQPMVYDPAEGYLLMFGGDLGSSLLNDAWEYRAGWKELCSDCEAIYRPGSHAAFDASDGYVVFVGGDTKGHGATVAYTTPLTVKWTGATGGDAGRPVTLKAGVTGGLAPLKFSWTFGNGGTSSATSPTPTYATPGIYPVQLLLTDETGVTATLNVQLPIVAPPSVSATATPSAVDVNSSVAFSANASGGTGAITYAWSFGDGATATGSAASHAYTTAGVYSGKVTVTDAAGGTGNASFVVTVSSGPVPSIAASPAPSDVGVPVAFTGTEANGTAPFVYAWNFADGTNASGPNATHSYSAPGNFTVVLEVTDADGRTASTSRIVSVVPGPQLAIDVPSTGDLGVVVPFNATVTGGVGPVTFAWRFGDGNTSASAATSHAFDWTGSYNFSVSATDALGVVVNLSGTVAIGPDPTVTLLEGPVLNATVGQPVELNATASGGTGGFDYAWDFGDGNASTGANSSHAFGASGNFTVTVTVTDSSGGTATAQLSVQVSSAPRPRRR